MVVILSFKANTILSSVVAALAIQTSSRMCK